MANPKVYGPSVAEVSAYPWFPMNYEYVGQSNVGVFVVTSGGGEVRFRLDRTTSPIYKNGAVIEAVTASIVATIGNGGRAVVGFDLTNFIGTAVRPVIQQVSGSALIKIELLRNSFGWS